MEREEIDMELEVCLLESVKCSLKAPVSGNMNRTIREGAACRARYRFCKKGSTVFCFETVLPLNMNIHELVNRGK